MICKTCEGLKKVQVPNGEDDFDVVPCPDCSLEVKDEDMSGATEGDR